MADSTGKLYLIPAPLGDDYPNVLMPDQLELVFGLRIFISERSKTTRRYLKAWGTPVPFSEITYFELNKHTDPADISGFLEPAIKGGKDIGLISEAGCPGVADPGAVVVALAHQNGMEVVPLIGPSSLLLALMASGMNGQEFAFRGYLPVKARERISSIKGLERTARNLNQTQLFIETPYRNNDLLKDLIRVLSGDLSLCIAANLTLPNQLIMVKHVANWRKATLPDLHKQPTVFVVGFQEKIPQQVKTRDPRFNK